MLRSAHMLFSFCILPVCLLYVRETQSYADLNGALLWLVVGGAVLWAMLYILLTQFAYPTSLWGALFTTGGLYANGVASANLGDFNIFYAAYATAYSALVAQSLFFLAIALAAWLKGIAAKYLQAMPIWYRFFLMVCAASLGAFAWLMHRPFVAEMRSEPRFLMIALCSGFFLWQILSDLKILYNSSAINNAYARQGKETWNLYEAYGTFSAVGLIFSLIAALVAAQWY